MVVRSFLCLRRRAKISGYNDISALRRESIFGWAASSKQAVADLRRSADEERSGSPILRAPRDERCSKSDRGGRPHLFREDFRVVERFILPKSGRSGYYRFCNYGNSLGYALLAGNSELVLSLSKIQNFDVISFLNESTTGTVTISISNSKLAAASSQWHQIAQQNLTAKVTKINVGPTEAKYVKFSFSVANSGRIAQLAVYSTANLTVATTALAGAVDGKDAKDFGDGKEAKEVAEGPPEEGPPPNLPDPPPFVFVPLLSE